MTVTLITGGSSGIGEATARRLLDRGHRVVVTGRDEDRLARVAKELDVLTVAGDTTDYESVTAAVDTALNAYGRLDNVVANAGFATHDTLADGDPERWRGMLLTNVLGPAYAVRAALPALRESRGRVVLVGSVAGVKNTPGNIYSVTKWAVTALAENTRMLVTGWGIGVTLIAPGRVDTPFWPGPVSGPALSADDIAGTIDWALGQPPEVDLNTVVVRPKGQAV
ncbi:SDR family oxidoreductase [Spongiactinospora sp. TRM90649]|uniref:SDR family oxidoreductase n=1 Tax=Spongiactinospora sp. TRM90649 TaxID=3031114 RepID=UPI0023F8BD98|nr:SDR family oxidoreductase [Spongiactinospora sp. TRM90649]MDF5756955.1 SDR family oxidoreductase [Spongiactinospora sp. TRM90649]